MRIGVICPPWLPVPPPGYGGIEVSIWGITEALVKRGQEVLLFAPGDSRTSARLVPTVNRALGQDLPKVIKPVVGDLVARYAYSRSIVENAGLVHDHTLANHDVPIKAVHTLHGPAAEWLVERARQVSVDAGNNFFVAISNRQRELYGGGINFIATIHHGVDVESIPFSLQKEDYLFFIGRANWEKGLDLAMRVAMKAGRRLIMAVKMSEQAEKDYFDKTVRPYLGKVDVKVLEEVSQEEKNRLYAGAIGTLFTSQWEEPFGLVMIESMAAGTPVIALRRGAAPEVIIDGVNGFLGEDEDDLVAAVSKLGQIDPLNCRRHIEENFTYDREAEEYIRVYEKVIG